MRTAWNKGLTNSHWVGSKNPRWNGGVYINDSGYRFITTPGHPHSGVRGYVREHRLVMERHLGRYLDPKEDVHHIDGNKLNNSIENLELFSSRSAHLKTRHRDGGSSTWFKKGSIPVNKYLTPKICISCDKEFQPKNGKNVSKYCSHRCYWNSKKGAEPEQLRRLHAN